MVRFRPSLAMSGYEQTLGGGIAPYRIASSMAGIGTKAKATELSATP